MLKSPIAFVSSTLPFQQITKLQMNGNLLKAARYLTNSETLHPR